MSLTDNGPRPRKGKGKAKTGTPAPHDFVSPSKPGDKRYPKGPPEGIPVDKKKSKWTAPGDESRKGKAPKKGKDADPKKKKPPGPAGLNVNQLPVRIKGLEDSMWNRPDVIMGDSEDQNPLTAEGRPADDRAVSPATAERL